MVRALLGFLLFLSLLSSSAGDLKKVIRAFEKQDWPKTEETIKKALENESINPGIRYYYSLLYANYSFVSSNMDSARIQIRWAIEDYQVANADLLEEMMKEGLDSAQLYQLLVQITDVFYEAAQAEMSVKGWQQFIDLFNDAPQFTRAIDQRDSIALEAVKLDGSIDAWKQFLEEYPDSKYKKLVVTKRDSLMISGYILNHNVEQIRAYVAQHPQTEISDLALKHLLKMVTISGSSASFLSFINEYKKEQAASRAVNWLFHIDKEDEFILFEKYKNAHAKTDSLAAIKGEGNAFYFPVFDEGFLLVSATKENKKLTLSTFSDDIICNGWTADIIDGMLDGRPVVLSRNGKKLAEGRLVKDLGKGLMLIEKQGVKSIYHKTGTLVIKDVEDAEILQGKVVKVKKEKWGLFSLMGLELADFRFDDIFVEGNFWFFEQDKLLATATFDQLIDSFPEGLYLEFKFDDYEMISPDELIGFRDDRECLLKSDRTFRVPWGKHQIYPSDSLGFIRDESGFALYGQAQYMYFPYMEANAGFVLSKSVDSSWRLYSNLSKWSAVYQDSLRLLNPYFALKTGAERKLILHNKDELILKATQTPFVFSPQSRYLLLKDKVTQVINDQGKIMFSGNFDEIRFLSDTLFSVSFRKKHGLISASGKELLPIKFEYIDSKDGMISVLLNGKIGALDLTRNVRFEPELESRPERMGKYYKTMKAGKYGLIDSLQQTVISFNYDGLEIWTDQSAWVQSGDQYSLIDLTTGEVQREVTSFSPLGGSGDLYKFYGAIGFGIISKKLGVIVPAEFTEVRLMGTGDKGVLMAEQALPEAGFVVVTYYTLKGEKIYSHAYRKSDYEKVFCDD